MFEAKAQTFTVAFACSRPLHLRSAMPIATSLYRLSGQVVTRYILDLRAVVWILDACKTRGSSSRFESFFALNLLPDSSERYICNRESVMTAGDGFGQAG